MWIPVLIIVITIALMIGPILLLRPTARQSQVAELRNLALKQGLSVKIQPNPIRASAQLAVYSCSLSKEKLDKLIQLDPPWTLIRQNYIHDLHFFRDWDWLGSSRPPDSMQNYLQLHLVDLDSSIIGVEITRHSVGCFWTEKVGQKQPELAVTEIHAWLKGLAEV